MAHVYYLTDNDKVVYVGSSVNYRSRLSSHRANGKVFTGYLAVECTDAERYTLEAAGIAEHQPNAVLLA